MPEAMPQVQDGPSEGAAKLAEVILRRAKSGRIARADLQHLAAAIEVAGEHVAALAEPTRGAGGTFVERVLRPHKAGCASCAPEGPGHGPYLYLRRTVPAKGGRRRRRDILLGRVGDHARILARLALIPDAPPLPARYAPVAPPLDLRVLHDD